jgi:hypothetical protein
MKVRLGPPRKNRAEHVHIDHFDVWSLDHTLSRIIHPALVRLKETKHGYPELFEDGMVTPHHWDRQLHFDFIDEEAYYGTHDYLWQKDEKVDWDAVQEGLELFGKYYMNLWD